MIRLKSQWTAKECPEGIRVTSETHSQVFPEDHQALFRKLCAGTEPDQLTDAEFDQLEALNAQGLVTTSDEETPCWELHGVSGSYVQQQLAHTTLQILDLCNEPQHARGARLTELLQAEGAKIVDQQARLVVVLTRSYLHVPVIPDAVILPIVCGRMRWSIGPYIFPWRAAVQHKVLKNPDYLQEPTYSLTPAWLALELGLCVTWILQACVTHRNVLANNTVEHNMLTQERHVWPIH